MALAKKRKLNPGPVAKAAERAHNIRLMKQGTNPKKSARACASPAIT
ncbi:hypothetical protein J2X98_003702 [Pseudarthrobacter enclensis]|uniref:Uncharacterized protein n=1 Tax=Pseudarthrobacter enclensis TaxID=993070 RepID=A0ABT9RXX0_9MICC|nr:hypothetical protein [Pseudarthrobacter enclensis]